MRRIPYVWFVKHNTDTWRKCNTLEVFVDHVMGSCHDISWLIIIKGTMTCTLRYCLVMSWEVIEVCTCVYQSPVESVEHEHMMWFNQTYYVSPITSTNMSRLYISLQSITVEPFLDSWNRVGKYVTYEQMSRCLSNWWM